MRQDQEKEQNRCFNKKKIIKWYLIIRYFINYVKIYQFQGNLFTHMAI